MDADRMPESDLPLGTGTCTHTAKADQSGNSEHDHDCHHVAGLVEDLSGEYLRALAKYASMCDEFGGRCDQVSEVSARIDDLRGQVTQIVALLNKGAKAAGAIKRVKGQFKQTVPGAKQRADLVSERQRQIEGILETGSEPTAKVAHRLSVVARGTGRMAA